jgi:hypothetical protein
VSFRGIDDGVDDDDKLELESDRFNENNGML